MVAPVVGFVVAFFTGATLPAAVIGAGVGAEYGKTIAAVDRTSAVVYGNLEAICPLTDHALDKAQTRADSTWGKRHKFWARLLDRAVADADAICGEAYGPNTPANRLRAAAAALDTIAKINGVDPEPETAPPAAVIRDDGPRGHHR